VDFFNIPFPLEEWYKSGCVEAVIIYGPSGTGKTEMMKSFLHSKGIRFLFIRNIHGLREYDPLKHKAIFFDDIYFEKMLTSEQHIGLSDTVNHSDIRIIRDSVRVLAETLRIFTTNNPRRILSSGVENPQVLSRYVIIKIDKSLFKEEMSKDLVSLEMNLRSEKSQELVAHNRRMLKEFDEERENGGLETSSISHEDFQEKDPWEHCRHLWTK